MIMSQSQPPSSPQQPKHSHLFDLFEPNYNQLDSRPNSTQEAEIVIIEGQELGDKQEETEGLTVGQKAVQCLTSV